MNAKVLIAGVAVAVMATGAASAKTMSGGTYAAPSQPIPYSQLDSYMKASPKKRAAMSASGMGTDASATTTSGSSMGAGSTPDSNGMSAGSTTSGSMSSDTTAPSTGAVNPPAPAATPDPMTPPK